MATNTTAGGIVLYDIAYKEPQSENSSAPNPWKARYALNFKGTQYKTKFIDMLQISNVRRALNVPAARKHRDGSEYYTLPVLIDNNTGAKLGDSFDIAVYLSETYPNSGGGDLFPEQSLDFACSSELASFAPPLSERAEGMDKGILRDYAKFNRNVDAVFSAGAALMGSGMPFADDRVADIQAEFSRRAGNIPWEKMMVPVEARKGILASLNEALEPLAVLFKRDPSGPFLLGKRASHADFIVGGWLRMQSVTMPPDEWAQIRGWHGGVFGKLHDALRPFSQVK